MPDIRAAIFDIGGVLTHSPVTAIKTFCSERGISDDARVTIFAGDNCAWSRFERSELTPAEFVVEFNRHLRDSGSVDYGDEFMQWFGQGFGPRPEMIAVVEHLRGRVRLGAITNNIVRDEAVERTSGVDVQGLFEVVIESALVGVRKPEPRIYHMACEALSVEPHEAVFLDDMGVNLKGAKALGMATIRVDHTLSAVDELENILGIPLPRP